VKKTDKKFVFFILVNIILSIFITTIFLYHAVGKGDIDNSIDIDHDSSQFSDDDYDYIDNSLNVNNKDNSLYQSNIMDIDEDGIEDFEDIYDFGNAGIKIYIKSFCGDGIDYTYLDFKVPWDQVIPFLK
jgi:hypothetical protein